MKVGIVSCYFQHNYGSMLQAYATQMALDRLGYENETIDISGFQSEIRSAKLRYFIKASLTSDILRYKFGMAQSVLRKKLLKDEYARMSALRSRKFESFQKKYFRMSAPCTSKAQLGEKCRAEYNAVMVGSDQLWLPANIAAGYYTLEFVPPQVNTIAYATSFGQSLLPRDSARRASVFLKKLRHIGVREASGQRLVQMLAKRRVPVVCDPTLLFSGEEWLPLQQEKPILEQPYILCYFLGKNKLHRQFAQRLKQATGCRIVALPHLDEFVRADDQYADEKRYDIDPADFLNLIRHAAFVCTDSFHCSVFSILYRKSFFTFRRYQDATIHSTNGRLDSLFQLLGLSERLLSGDEAVLDCLNLQTDEQKVKLRLAQLRESSYQYLKSALEDRRSTDLPAAESYAGLNEKTMLKL